MKTKLITFIVSIFVILGSVYALTDTNERTKVSIYKNGGVVYSGYITNIDSIMVETKKYTVSVSSTTGGSATTSSNSVESNGSVTLTATPNFGYQFVNWTSNGNVVSTSNPYTATITEDSEFVANFEENPYCAPTENMSNGVRRLESFTIGDSQGNNLSVDGIQPQFTSPVYVNKTDRLLTTFKGETLNFKSMDWKGEWMHAYVYIDYNNDGEFNQTNELVSYNFYSSNSSSTGVNSKGESVSNNCGVTAGNIPSWTIPTDLPGGTYRLRLKIDWNNKDACGSTQQNNDIATNGGCICDISICVKPAYTVSVSSTAGGSATVSANSVESNGSVTLTAAPNFGYQFVNWTLNGNVVSTSNPYTATITEDSEFVANFEKIEKWFRMKNVNNGYYLSFTNHNSYTTNSRDNAGMGVIGYADNEDQLFKLESADNGKFYIVSKSGYYIYCTYWQCHAHQTLKTQFTVEKSGNYYTIYQAESLDQGNTSYGYLAPQAEGSGKIVYCDNAATSGYKTWYLENSEGGNICITVSVNTSDTTKGTATTSSNSVELLGGSVTLTATPNSGYQFVNWTLNGNVVSTLNPYTATITEDSEFVANFSVLSKENGHEYVDLGLPSGIKWATCNVGANTPEGYGDYFAWGETQPKGSDSWSTYKYCNGDGYSMTKYCTDSKYGTVDNKTTLELSDDAARVNWGGKWRMPTSAEQDELRDKNNCTWEWTTQNGVKGYKVTSVKNGNFIFLPVTGFYNNYDGYYWSSSLSPTAACAYTLFFYSSYLECHGYYRRCVQSVRAVFREPYAVLVSSTVGGSATTSSNSVESNGSVTLTATPNSGFQFVNWTLLDNVVSTSNPYTVTITKNSVFVANFEEKPYCAPTENMSNGARRLESFTIGDSQGNNLSVDGIQPQFTSPVYVDKTDRLLTTIKGETLNFKSMDWKGEWMHAYVYIDYNNDREFNQTNELVSYNFYSSKSSSLGVDSKGTTVLNDCGVTASNIPSWTIPADLPGGTYRLRLKIDWNNKDACGSAQQNNDIATNGGCICDISISVGPGYENGHEYVDLGLPSGIKWATCNVGADTPEEYGDYFAWGETQPKDYYDWSTYKYCNGTDDTMTKYCVDSEYGTIDYKTTLELSDDAARVNWGGKWRMPTEAEQDELRNTSNCTWTWTTQNGVKGYKVTSKKNGNSIFLPAAGFRSDSDLRNAGKNGRFWSSSLYVYNYSSNYAFNLHFYSNNVHWNYKDYRYYGQSVRAVCE